MARNHSLEEFLEAKSYYRTLENIFDSIRGRELEFTKTLPFLVSIDLSNNNMVGEIPEEIMDLYALLNLKLATNHLVGRIPEAIRKLKKIGIS